MVSVSQCISAAAGATYPTSGYLAGFTEVVINWLCQPTALQNLLLLHLYKRVRILSSYAGNIMDHWGRRIFLECNRRILFLSKVH